MGLELAGRFFAHHIDGAAGAACAGEQPGCTLENFDPVVNGSVGQGVPGRVLRVLQDRNAVVLKVLDRKTARIVAGAITVIGCNGDAGGMAHHIIDRVETEIVHCLARYHGYRLWGFARRQHHARGSSDAAGGVGARTFCDGAQLVGADLRGAQFQTAARRRQRIERVAIGTFNGGIAAAAQQSFESGMLVVGAVQPGSRQSVQAGGLKNNRYPGLLCKAIQGAAQRAGWNVIGFRC